MTSVTWETAADWDAAQSESGVVHESVSNTDHSDDTELKKGYRIASPFKATSLEIYLPMHEDSGTTMYDFSGNNRDGTYSGPTLNQQGLLSTTAADFDGTDDRATFPQIGSLNAFTISFWIYPRDLSTQQYVLFWRQQMDVQARIESDGNMHTYVSDTDSSVQLVSNLTANVWQNYVLTWDGSTVRQYLNGSQVDSAAENGVVAANNSDNVIGDNFSGTNMNGKMQEFRIHNTAYSASEVQTIYDVVNTAGTHTTGKKTS